MLQIGGATVLWKSLKQHCTAPSSTEAEYVSLSEVGREVTWLRELLAELKVVQKSATTVYQDDTGSMDWTSDTGHFRKNEHIDVRFHHVRDLVKQSIIDMQFGETSLVLADILTKPLHGPKLKADVQRLGIADEI